MRFYRALKRTICSLGRFKGLGFSRVFSRGPCGFTRSRFRAYKGQKNAIVQRAARRTHRLPSRSGSTRSRVQGLRARKAHACRGAFRGARKTHRLPSRCDSSRSRVYGLEKCMRAGVRLGGPEKRTGSLRVVIPPGAGFRA